MGFIGGVITGLAMAAAAAAWYMSRSGAKFRDQYRVDRRLGEFGDEIELRTRDVRAQVGAQVAETREKVMAAAGDDGGAKLDEATAAAAEEAAELAADVESKAGKIKRAAKSTEADAEDATQF